MKQNSYLNKILGGLLMTVLSLATFFFVFYLTDTNMQYFIISMQVTLVFFAIYCFTAYFLYKSEINKDDKINELTLSIKELEEKTIQDRQELMDYFFVWVHQIKTPITSAKLLVDTEDIPCAPQLKEDLFEIDTYTEMALNYLKLCQTSADMEISVCNLSKIVKDILKRYSILFFNNHNSIQLENLDHTVVSDPKWLSILIEQLISNAVKYTNNGTITISFDENTQILSIQDTGCGIRPEDQNRIFERGYSGFNGQYNEKSSGIGLFLAQQISKKLELEISFDSMINQGSTFYIHFSKTNLTKL